MNFGETIKKLRRNKDMTQEQLAEYLNISTQAVSRWETNTSLPDITLIPALANIFDVTSDMLLGIDITNKEKRIQEIRANAFEYTRNGYKDKALEILRDGLKEYPNSYWLMLEIIQNIWIRLPDTARTVENKKEAIYLGEKILAECTDDHIRHQALRWLCEVYSNIGERDKAEKLALTLPFSFQSRDELLTTIYSGDKKHKQIRNNIYKSIMDLQDNIKFIIHYPLDNDHNPYTTEERIVLHKKFIEILNIIFDDGDYGEFDYILEWSYRDMAIYLIQIGNYKEAVENLKMASEYAIKRDKKSNSEQEYTSLFLRGKKFINNTIYSSPNNYSKDLLEIIQWNSSFDVLRGNDDFNEIVENLKKHAKKR